MFHQKNIIKGCEEGIGFGVDGGRFLPITEWEKHFDEAEYHKEFDKLNTTEEDKQMMKTKGQTEYVQAMKELYTELFSYTNQTKRTITQASDVPAATSITASA